MSDATQTIAAGGWGSPSNSKKHHWFNPGEFASACGRWAFFGERTPDTGNTSPGRDDCAGCFRKLVKRREAEKAPETPSSAP